MAGKVKSSKSKTFVKGGSKKMFGFTGSKAQASGVSYGRAGNPKAGTGGSTKMFGYSGSKPSKAR